MADPILYSFRRCPYAERAATHETYVSRIKWSRCISLVTLVGKLAEPLGVNSASMLAPNLFEKYIWPLVYDSG